MIPEDDISKLNKLVRDAMGDRVNKPFRPFAVFDSSLDRVVVLNQDCSYTEIRISRALAILEKNYPQEGENKYIGLEIWGIRHFCRTHRMMLSGKTDLKILLDYIMAEYPCPDDLKVEMYKILGEVSSVKLPARPMFNINP